MTITDKKPTYLYEHADAIRHGDYLPDVSRFPVASVTVSPNDNVRVTFQGTEYGTMTCGWPSTPCEGEFNCCDCGLREDGCGCPYCWSCNACDDCYGED